MTNPALAFEALTDDDEDMPCTAPGCQRPAVSTVHPVVLNYGWATCGDERCVADAVARAVQDYNEYTGRA
jgi:hypothetical protein